MIFRSWTTLLGSLLVVGIAGIANAEELSSIFNGKDLTGWNGDPSMWSVRDGVIHGEKAGFAEASTVYGIIGVKCWVCKDKDDDSL